MFELVRLRGKIYFTKYILCNVLQWWVGHVWCLIALWSYLTMVVHLSSRRPALPGHSGASLTQLEILGSCVIFLESEMEKIFSTWLFQTAPDKVWQHLQVVWWTFQQMKERNNKDKLMCLLKGLVIFFSNSKFKALKRIVQQKQILSPKPHILNSNGVW